MAPWVIAMHAAFFAALLAVMFYIRWASEEWPVPFHFASLLMVAALTMFAAAGSVTMQVATKAVKLENTEPAVRWIAIAITCWLTFLFLEVVEVRLVYLVGLGPRTAFGGTFLALTGTHWIAVCACISWMTMVASNTRKRDAVAVAMYSHFLVLVWIVLANMVGPPTNRNIWTDTRPPQRVGRLLFR